MPNHSTENLVLKKSANAAPLLSPLQSTRAVMANNLKPVKISQDIFNQTTPDLKFNPYMSRTENFGRRNCSKPLASIEA